MPAINSSVLYFPDVTGRNLRKVDTTGTISTVGLVTSSDPVYLALKAEFSLTTNFLSIGDVCVDPHGNLYVWDTSMLCIFKIDTNLNLTTILGTSPPTNAVSGVGGPSINATLHNVSSIVCDAAGNLYLSGASSASAGFHPNLIFGINTNTTAQTMLGVSVPAGDIEVLFGSIVTAPPTFTAGPNGVTGTSSYMSWDGSHQSGGVILAIDGNGNVYFGDILLWFQGSSGSVETFGIRRVDAASGIVTLVAGNATPFSTGGAPNPTTGPALSSYLYNTITTIAADLSGNVYFEDTFTGSDFQIAKLSGGNISVVAGTGTAIPPPTGDGGSALSANLYNFTRLKVDSAGNIYIGDSSHYSVREVFVSTGIIDIVAGTYTNSGSTADGVPATTANLNGVLLSVGVALFATPPPPPPPPPPPLTASNSCTGTQKYQWIQYVDARKALAQRLSDPGNAFWTDAENGLYIIEALRTWNALTEVWNCDVTFTANSAAGEWINLAGLTGSPRIRTVTDNDLYVMMQLHLLEPTSGGGTWTGTSQFSLAALQAALQRRRDEVIQASGCNPAQLSAISVIPNTYRVSLPDNVLEPRRARFLGSDSSVITLTLEDSTTWDHFEPYHLQAPGLPASWGVTEGPPLTIDLDVKAIVPGELDVLALVSGPIFAPPALSLLGVPDDWSWLCKWGALADLLSFESEATDQPRAQFCQKMFADSLKLMRASNWVIAGQVNGLPVDIPYVSEMDQYSPEWEENETSPYIVSAGMDLIAPCPLLTGEESAGVTLTLVANAPIPSGDGDYVQVSRDTFDAILSYAQALAMFKQGGAEFMAAQPLIDTFFTAAKETNARLAKMGLYFDVMKTQGRREQVEQPR